MANHFLTHYKNPTNHPPNSPQGIVLPQKCTEFQTPRLHPTSWTHSPATHLHSTFPPSESLTNLTTAPGSMDKEGKFIGWKKMMELFRNFDNEIRWLVG